MFIQIEDSLVNINHIVRFRKWKGSYQVLLSDDTHITFSPEEYQDIKRRLTVGLYTIK